MRIGVNCFLLAPHIGGIRQYFFSLFDYLLAEDIENDYIFFYGSTNLSELALLNSDRWRKNGMQLQDEAQIRHFLDQFDLYFCPFSVLRPRPLPKPSVVTLPDIQEVYYPQFFSEADRFSRDRHFRASTLMADQIITHSQFSRGCLIESLQVSPTKISIAHHCIDRRYTLGKTTAQRPVQSIPKDFIFYPANLWPHKNHDALLRALQRLQQTQNLIVPLVLTGFEQSGGYPLAQKVIEYGLERQIHPLGYIHPEELLYLYSQAQMLIFPSLFEGFALPLVEAMTVGCPVVAANATAIPEVIGEAGLLFDPSSPVEIAAVIAQVWQNEDRRQQMIKQGKQQSQQFSAALTAQKHQQAFQAAVQAYSYRQFLWHHWVDRPYHNLQIAWKWRRRLMSLVSQKLRSQLHSIGDKDE